MQTVAQFAIPGSVSRSVANSHMFAKVNHSLRAAGALMPSSSYAGRIRRNMQNEEEVTNNAEATYSTG
jgi:hypothetical protein